MTRQTDILTAINRLLVERFPDYTVYVQDCPKDFKRPSFLLEFIRLSQVDANRITVEKTIYYTITCFVPVDKRYCSDTEELIDLQEDVLQIFSQGFIKVGDRAIKVQGSTGGMSKNETYIDLQFEFFDNRTDEEDKHPLITSVTTNIKEG